MTNKIIRFYDDSGDLVPVLATDNGDGTFSIGIGSENHVGEVGMNMITVGVERTRPADTNAYAALDAVADSTSAPTVITFSNIARISGGSGYIVKARLLTDQVACVARFRLHLFNAAPTPINDNSPYTLLYANAAVRIGEITFPALKTEGTGSTGANAIDAALRMAFVTSGSRNLYGLLETLDGFTPASAQKIYVALTADNN